MRNPANPLAYLAMIPSLLIYYEVGQVSSKFTRIRMLPETPFTQYVGLNSNSRVRAVPAVT